MNETVTINHLVAYLYGELPVQLAETVAQAIATDQRLSNEYYRLKEAHDLLPQAVGPSDAVIDQILRYSRDTAVELPM